MNNRIAFIINPVSGTANKKQIAQYIAKNVPQAEIYFTTCVGDATHQAKIFADAGYQKVVAVGGDGTVNEVASGLICTSTALGIVPLGSGNGLARHLGLPLNAEKAVDMVSKGEVVCIDFGLLNQRPFFCTAGVGFDAKVGRRFAKARHRGLLGYAQTSLMEYFRHSSESYKITIDGFTFSRKAFLITFANASQWGFNAYIAPNASISDGLLDMVILSPFPLVKAPLVGLRMFTKSIHHSNNIEVFQFKEATIERECPGYIHLDGEPSRELSKLQVSNVPKSLFVIVSKKPQ